MAIDKLIPRFLVSDEDERLLEEGAMTDALNVTISENGDNTLGVIKAMKGTIGATASTSSDQITDGDSITAIGSVTDDVNGKIYFFVADDSGTSQDGIYQYDTATDTYKDKATENGTETETPKETEAEKENELRTRKGERERDRDRQRQVS